jgi:hypothetical protein
VQGKATCGATMTRRDFNLIAGVLREQRTRATAAECWRLDETARAFALELAATNARFNRDRFLAACGVEA